MSHKLFSDDKLEAIYRAAVSVLGRIGMKVKNRQCLEALERFGAQIDYPNERAVFSEAVIDRMMAIVKHDHTDWHPTRPTLPREMGLGTGGTCPFYFDEEKWQPRLANEADCIQACKVVDASSVAGSIPPVYNSESPPKFASIRCMQIALETFGKTTCFGMDLFFPEQVPFIVELGELYRNDPCCFLPAGNCPVSPLEVGTLTADLAIAKASYKMFYAVPTMPIAGASAPVTPAGTAVVGVAEILGGFILAKALNPETPVGAAALSAKLDMKTGNVVYVAPEVFAADIAIVEVCQSLLHFPCAAFGMYADAKTPGMRAVYEKIMSSVGLGLYGSLTTFEGTVDQGKVFSAAQLMLDCDMHQFLAEYTSEPEVSKGTLAVEEIINIGWESTGYMMAEHTTEHMREAWVSTVYQQNPIDERELIAKAQELCRDNLRRYQPPDHSDEFLRDLRNICEKAKQALC
jgi:trimethylamine---corrinoid protein Co-methyltransferase